MAPNKHLASWKVAASESGKNISELFPVCNDREQLPISDLDNFAHRSLNCSEYLHFIPRCDFLLCLRALKLIEQIAFSRSRLAIGPLQMTLSIACILETSSSWTSVFHALGIVTSYDSTEKLRKRLVAEREQSCEGALENVKLEDRVVTVQMDNFDIHRLNSVKASGKTLPMVSGTVTKGVVQSRKRSRVSQDTPASTSRDPVALDAWLDPKTVLKPRAGFASSFYLDDDKSILDEFFDVVFGVPYENRAVLVGESASVDTHRCGRNAKAYKHKGPNFRTLLLFFFQQHGGLDNSNRSLYDQEAILVDVSRMSAADALTIHAKISMLKDLIRPGEPGRPRYIVCGGDQPTFKMIVKLWRKSYFEAERNENAECPYGELKVHPWLIPFPGFFHIEKQSLYPVCKELLYGLGLEEMAACSALSKSQVENILKHSHSRNDRAVLFNICAAMVVHASDIIQVEFPDVWDAIDSLSRAYSSNNSTSAGTSKLLSATTDKVSKLTVDADRLLRRHAQDFFSQSPNGKHIVRIILMTCLLLTVGFHILSRTGHTDLVDSFWLRQNNILHTSGHIKYQELYLYYGFFRAIMPRIAFADLFTNKPGAMVARVPSFTDGMSSPYDHKGWVYVHLDELQDIVA